MKCKFHSKNSSFSSLCSVMALAAADGGHGGHGGGHGGHGGYGHEVYAHTPPHYSYKVRKAAKKGFFLVAGYYGH